MRPVTARSAISLPRIFHGWYIVGVIYLSLFLAAGLGSFAFSILLPQMVEDLGWSRSVLVGAASLASLAASAISPWSGSIVDRYGGRLLLAMGLLGMGIAAAASGLIQEPWQFYLSFGLLLGIARGAATNAAPSAIIAQWFLRKRPRAFSAVSVGPPSGGLLFPPLTALLLTVTDWRTVWVVLGSLAIGATVLPLFLVHRRPEDIGLAVDGRATPLPDPSLVQTPTTDEIEGGDWSFHEAIRSVGFWGIAISLALIQLVLATVLLFLFSFFRERGLPETVSATVVSLVYLVQIFTRVAVWGPLIARFGSVRWPTVIWAALLGAGAVSFVIVHNEATAYLTAAFFGIGMGGTLIIMLQLWPEYFGKREVGAIGGAAYLVTGLTSAVGPLLGAAILDLTGNYDLMFIAVGSFVLVGIAIQVVVGKPRHRGQAR